jgi:hypothetical protein
MVRKTRSNIHTQILVESGSKKELGPKSYRIWGHHTHTFTSVIGFQKTPSPWSMGFQDKMELLYFFKGHIFL